VYYHRSVRLSVCQSITLSISSFLTPKIAQKFLSSCNRTSWKFDRPWQDCSRLLPEYVVGRGQLQCQSTTFLRLHYSTSLWRFQTLSVRFCLVHSVAMAVEKFGLSSSIGLHFTRREILTRRHRCSRRPCRPETPALLSRRHRLMPCCLSTRTSSPLRSPNRCCRTSGDVTSRRHGNSLRLCHSGRTLDLSRLHLNLA